MLVLRLNENAGSSYFVQSSFDSCPSRCPASLVLHCDFFFNMPPPKRPLCTLSERQKRRRLNGNSNIVKQSIVSVADIENREAYCDLPPQFEINQEVQDHVSESEPDVDMEIVNSGLDVDDGICEHVENESILFPDPIEISDCDLYGNKECIKTQSVIMHNNSESIKCAITEWAHQEKGLALDCVSRLLVKLNKTFPTLPICAKTLLKKEPVVVNQCDEGEYWHCPNWKECLLQILENYYDQCTSKKFYLSVNIDGMPLYNSSSSCYTTYPILVKPMIPEIKGFPTIVLCVGIYCSNKFDSKNMPDTEIFLSDFIRDIKELQNGLITKKGEIKMVLGPFICDAPIRSALKEIIGHCGYSSCERCTEYGDYKFGRVVFPGIHSRKRTDATFLSKCDLTHNKSLDEIPLESVFSEFVSGFVLDYMHSFCIGVVKRILTRLLTSNNKDVNVNMSPMSKKLFAEKLEYYQSYIPCDFNRKLEGGIVSILHWKASQYRLFAIYIGCVIFDDKNIISKNMYRHFLNLSVAFKLLLSDGQQDNCDFIENILKRFVVESKEIYGLSFVSYNVHSLIHIADDYRKYGNLENISAFPFESYLGSQIKASVRSGFQPLKQIATHIITQNERSITDKIAQINMTVSGKRKCNHESFHKDQCVCYTSLNYIHKLKTVLDDNIANSCVQLTDGSIGLIEAIHTNSQSTFITVKTFNEKNDFFSQPVKSSKIGIYCVKGLKKCLTVPACSIFSKMIIIPHRKNAYIVQKLI